MAPPNLTRATEPATRPYRDFVTPVLHQRFTNAASYTLVYCWLIAAWQGLEWRDSWMDIFVWNWFPLGPVGVRTLLLFVSALIVYILHISQYHVGERNTQKGVDTFVKYAVTPQTVVTVVCYALSAGLYGEIYIWSQPASSKLGYTDQGKNYERLRLNERPMYLRYMFFVFSLVQSGLHLWYDYDRIDFPPVKPRNEQDAAPSAPAPKPYYIIAKELSRFALQAVLRTVVVTSAGTMVYFAGLRYQIWPPYYSFARSVLMISLSKARPNPNTLPPFLFLLAYVLGEGFLLLFMWQFINITFKLNMSQPPLKNGLPITSDSTDPNGSLLKGLKAKKPTIRAVALWELAIITEAFEVRRKTIYSEIHRKTAPTFKQVVDVCLSEIKLLVERCSIGLDPNYHPKEEKERFNKATLERGLVPRIAPSLKDVPIKGPGLPLITAEEKFSYATEQLAKSLSSPENSKKTREFLKQRATEASQQLQKGVEVAEAQTSGFYAQFMASPLGVPFRRSLRRTANLIVTGAPYSRLSMLCNAITILTNLTLKSLVEDEYGRAQDEVARIVRMFTEALKQLDNYMAELQVPWSDFQTLAKPEAERKRVAEVEEVRECLRSGLEKILNKFGEYLTGLGMTRAEIQEAKKMAGNGPQMAEVR